MTTRFQERAKPDGNDKGRDAKPASGQAADDACRCKETAAMTPRELLRRMMSDLAFWKKERKD